MLHKRVNYTQPNRITSVDWSLPHAQFLDIAVLPDVAYTRAGALPVKCFDSNASIVPGSYGKALKTAAVSDATGLLIERHPAKLRFSNGEAGSTLICVMEGTTGGSSGPAVLGTLSNGYGYSGAGVPRLYTSGAPTIVSSETMVPGKLHVVSYGWKYSASDTGYVALDSKFTSANTSLRGGPTNGNDKLYGHSSMSGYGHGLHKIYLMLLFDRLLPVNLARLISANPWSVFKCSNSYIFTDIIQEVSFYSPASDIQVTGWTASTGVILADCVDEAVLDRSDYISSPNSANPGPCVLALSSPLPAGNWAVHIDLDRVIGITDYEVQLLNDSNEIQGSVIIDGSPIGTPTTQILNVTTTGLASRIRLAHV